MIENELVTLLAGSGVGIEPAPLADDATLPYSTFSIVSDVPESHQDNASYPKRIRLQVDSYAVKRLDARARDKAIEAVLNGYKGTLGVYRIGGIWRENRFEQFEEAIERRRVTSDYVIRVDNEVQT